MDLKAPSLGACRYLLAPQPDYWADPFLMEHSGQLLLFVEQYVDACKRGVIVCIRLDADGTATKLGVALDEPFHLSYPQIFRWQDAWYMTVESCDANRVSLYRAEDFPLRWVHESDLIHGRVCVDPTLEYHDGRWYLFANVSESGGNPSDELFLFVADALHGPYLPHPANPVSVDVRNARPAGRLFRRDGCLFRPAQCCAPEYGSAVVFNEVLELSPDHYVERAVSRLAPYWSEQLDGCHTYNATGNQEVLDAHGQPPSMAMRIRVTESDQV
ncbi:hypothetical protein CSC70_10085 [Pseudoxanthomonas kalamensis DSM 18571]|nr:hypothetical protein CSC70_10085 [Pseudoxanthomonas kalamensis DSM 18571]